MNARGLCIFDLDGVLYGADPGLVDPGLLYRLVAGRFGKVAIYTNDVTYSKSNRLSDLASNGTAVPEDQLFTPIDVLFDYVMPNMRAERCLFLGATDAIADRHREALVDRLEDAQCVAVGDIRDLDLRSIANDLNRAENLARPIFTLNENLAFSNGARDVGDFVATFALLLKRPKLLIGKPSATGFLALLKKFGVGAGDTLLVTDSIANDAHGAAMIGIDSVLVAREPYCPTDRFVGIDVFMRALMASPSNR